MTIMNYDHPQWKEFVDNLSKTAQECEHSYKQSWKVLEEMKLLEKIDIDSTIHFFCENGGYCDCEIMFNVVKHD